MVHIFNLLSTIFYHHFEIKNVNFLKILYILTIFPNYFKTLLYKFDEIRLILNNFIIIFSLILAQTNFNLRFKFSKNRYSRINYILHLLNNLSKQFHNIRQYSNNLKFHHRQF